MKAVGAGQPTRITNIESIPLSVPEPDYRDLVERAADMIYALDLDGRITYVNAAAMRLLGRKREELIGCHFRDVVASESLDAALEQFERGVREQTESPLFELQVLRPDGELVDLEIRAGGLYCDGVMVGRQGVARDISDLKRLQAQVDKQSKRLGLLEEQRRIAMDVYRRLALLTDDPTVDSPVLHQGLRRVERSLAVLAAERLGLSERDLRVVELIAEGRSNVEIAEAVHLSPNTVKDQVSKITAVLGGHGRAGVGLQAVRHGLITQH
jgi:PAS domain S-box-containing protein